MTITMPLTQEQLTALDPLFTAAQVADEIGKPGMVIAQIRPSGITAHFCDNALSEMFLKAKVLTETYRLQA